MIHYHMEMKPEGEPVMEFKSPGIWQTSARSWRC